MTTGTGTSTGTGTGTGTGMRKELCGGDDGDSENKDKKGS
jgi:hypothetical protein